MGYLCSHRGAGNSDSTLITPHLMGAAWEVEMDRAALLPALPGAFSAYLLSL